MKLLIGMPAEDSWGGPAASEPPFVDALRDLGIDVVTETYVYGDKERPTRFFERVSRVLRTALRFRRRLAGESFDLIHLNTAFDRKTVLRDAISILLMRPRRAHVFLKIHGSGAHQMSPRSVLFGPLIQYLRRHVDGLGVHTQEEIGDLQAHGFSLEKCYLVKNVIDIDRDLSSGSSRLQKSADETFELLFISRFINTKGLLETIKAASILRDGDYSFRLACIGDGPVRAEAEQLVRALKLEEYVTFTGYVSEQEVLQRLLDGDIFIFPTSHTEGFPNILFRSVALGLPVVTTRVRSAAEYLSEGQNCLFCTTEPKNIADRIEELINQPELRRQMSAVNIELGRRLTKEAIAQEFIEIYRRMCGEKTRSEV